MSKKKIVSDFEKTILITFKISKNQLKISVERNDEEGRRAIEFLKKALSNIDHKAKKRWLRFPLNGKIFPDFEETISMTFRLSKNHLTSQRRLKISVKKNDEEGRRAIGFLEKALSIASHRAKEDWLIFFLEK